MDEHDEIVNGLIRAREAREAYYDNVRLAVEYGLTDQKIGELLGVSSDAIRMYRTRKGIKRR